MKILITGATGLLGSRFYHIFGKYHDVIGTYFSKPKREFHCLSLLDKSSVDSLIYETKPDIVIHTAGIADPDKCEEDREKAYEINVRGTEYIVDACQRNQASLVFISSAHVFSQGKPSEKEKTKPTNYYGLTKMEAERYIRKHLEDYIILRPTKLYGFIENGADFTKTIIRKLKNDKELRIDNAIKYYPVITDDVVELTRNLIALGFNGTYNISTSKHYTKYEWAKLIADVFNRDKNKIKPIKEDTQAKRPMDLSLSTKKIQRLNFNPTTFKEGIYCLKKQMGCSFNLIYSFRPYKMIAGKSANIFRVNLGKALAREESMDTSHLDMVVPVPESGIYPAQGYADQIHIPLYHAIIMDYETKKTLYEPQIDNRVREIRKKLITIPDVVKGKRIIVVDEAIISGLTMANAIEKLERADAKEIHVRIPSPIMFNNCKYNVLAKDAKLIAKNFQGCSKEIIEEKLAKHFNVNSVRFLGLEAFKINLPNNESACLDCFLEEKL